jgi:putative ABC transport system permease protein
MKAGRNFHNDHPASDPSLPLNIIVNETAAHVFGFEKASEIIGKNVNGVGFKCNVIGVVNDYHQESLKNSFDPTIFYPEQEIGFSNFSVKLNTNNLPQLMEFAKRTWNARFPESPFRFFFLDEHFNEQYKNDRLFATVLWLFTILAVIVASLGLFGLSLYSIAKRKKEISIRKVLGATVYQITSLITKDYLKLILLAALVAVPLAWYLLNNWLTDYAFHIQIGLWFFILPVGLIVSISIMTVLYQSVRSALSNPVNNLRTE